MKLHEILIAKLASLGWTPEDIASGVKAAWIKDEPRISPRRRIISRDEFTAKNLPLSRVFNEIRRGGMVITRQNDRLISNDGRVVASLMSMPLVEGMFSDRGPWGQSEVDSIV